MRVDLDLDLAFFLACSLPPLQPVIEKKKKSRYQAVFFLDLLAVWG